MCDLMKVQFYGVTLFSVNLVETAKTVFSTLQARAIRIYHGVRDIFKTCLNGGRSISESLKGRIVVLWPSKQHKEEGSSSAQKDIPKDSLGLDEVINNSYISSGFFSAPIALPNKSENPQKDCGESIALSESLSSSSNNNETAVVTNPHFATSPGHEFSTNTVSFETLTATTLDKRAEADFDELGNLPDRTEYLSSTSYTLRWTDIKCPANTHVQKTKDGQLIQTTRRLFLHANYVQMEKDNYIALQAPGTDENEAFVQLISDANIYLIVDLSNAIDIRKDKAYSFIQNDYYYFPKEIGSKVNIGKMDITCNKVTESDKVVIYTYEIRDSQSKFSKTVKRVHFKNWPDHGTISSQDMIELVGVVDKLSQGKDDSAIVVHCRGGVGRTGTFITARTLLHLKESNKVSDSNYEQTVKKLVEVGRDQRGKSFVQTKEQFKSLYQLGQEIFHGQSNIVVQSKQAANRLVARDSIAEHEFPKTLKEMKSTNILIGGTTGPRVVEIDGKKYVRKQSWSQGHVEAEFYADKFYKAAGVPVAEVKLYHPDTLEAIEGEVPGDISPIMLSVFIEDTELLNCYIPRGFRNKGKTIDQFEEVAAKIRQHFVLDVLIANRDVIGLEHDNILITKEGTPIRIDNGSAFEYRAQGEIKPDGFAAEANEIDGLRSESVNWAAAKVFQDITSEEIIEQTEEIERNFDKLKTAVPNKYHDTLSKRLEYLKSYKNNLLIEKKRERERIQLEFNDSKKTVVIGKQFSCDGLTLNGVPFKKTVNGPNFSAVPDKILANEPPFDRNTLGLAISAGVLIKEPDGRIWVYEPRGHFGGYEHTFPKGREERGLTMQQTAIKEAFEESGLLVEIEGFAMDIDKTTTRTRYYYAKRIGGDPSQAGWEAANVKLATKKDLEQLLNMPYDKSILSKALS